MLTDVSTGTLLIHLHSGFTLILSTIQVQPVYERTFADIHHSFHHKSSRYLETQMYRNALKFPVQKFSCVYKSRLTVIISSPVKLCTVSINVFNCVHLMSQFWLIIVTSFHVLSGFYRDVHLHVTCYIATFMLL